MLKNNVNDNSIDILLFQFLQQSMPADNWSNYTTDGYTNTIDDNGFIVEKGFWMDTLIDEKEYYLYRCQEIDCDNRLKRFLNMKNQFFQLTSTAEQSIFSYSIDIQTMDGTYVQKRLYSEKDFEIVECWNMKSFIRWINTTTITNRKSIESITIIMPNDGQMIGLKNDSVYKKSSCDVSEILQCMQCFTKNFSLVHADEKNKYYFDY